jgi:formamidopyrimidine-DNA glycosylase
MIDEAVSAAYLKSQTSQAHSKHQAVIHNTIMCGLGNIYACDALHLAGIHPPQWQFTD